MASEAKSYGPLAHDVASTIRIALNAYAAETERYLWSFRSWPLDSPYDPECCDHCRTQHAVWQNSEESRQLLERRKQLINDALAHFGPSLDYVASLDD